MPKPGKNDAAKILSDAGVTELPVDRENPLWEGPCGTGPLGGITFSMLSRFLTCRERFRLYAIEGYRTLEGFNSRMEYGSLWHACEEGFAAKRDWTVDLNKYKNKLLKAYPIQQDDIRKWSKICAIQFPHYVDFWKKHPDVKGRVPLCQEQTFDTNEMPEKYVLASGRIVRLRGKWDSVDLIPDETKAKTKRVYLQENKSKGDPDRQQIQRQLQFDLQPMLYLVALLHQYEGSSSKSRAAPFLKDNGPPAGFRYNVIKRPLSGGKHSIRQHQGTKNKPGETEKDFMARLSGLIKNNPQDFFMRWKIPVSRKDIIKFRDQCLNPILEQLCDWYDHVVACKLEGRTPFGLYHKQADDATIAIHWQHPFGVYNVLDEGGSSDLDNYLETGSMVGLTRVDSLFGELAT